MTSTAGSLDVLAFTHLGKALPSAMTGNTALLGLALGQGRLQDAVPFALAFAAFCCGAAAVTAVLALWPDGRSSRHAVHRFLVAEAIFLAGFFLLWQFSHRPFVGGARDGLIVLAAFAMGMQGRVARLDNRPGVNTIVFTSTLGAIVEAATEALLRRPHRLTAETKRQTGMFAAYFLGALVAGVLVWFGNPLMAALPLALVLAALIFRWRAVAG